MKRLAAITAAGLVHLGVYVLVTRVNAARPAGALVDLASPLDARFPYWGWTWPFFWLAYPYILLGGAAILWRLPWRAFARGVVAFGASAVVGGAIQLALPARSPWPDAPYAVQRMSHAWALNLPYASLPSMHVAFTVLVAYLGVATVRSRWAKAGLTVGAILISLSTVTLKEHFVLDVPTGALLGLAAGWWWRRDAVLTAS